MAKAANGENVARDVKGPDYVEAIKLIRGPIARNKSDSSALGQDNSTLYKRIDKNFGVHPGAAKIFAGIDGMQEDKRTDCLRSLFGLIKNAGFGKFNDLVDMAEGKTTTAPKAEKQALPEHPADDSDLVKAGGDQPAPGEADGGASERAHEAVGRSPIAKAKAHLSAVPDAV